MVGFVEVIHPAAEAADSVVAGTRAWLDRFADPPDVGGSVDYATLCKAWRRLMEHG
jgi:hypothetical protein